MDITKRVTHISLCSGYGGIDLGLHRCIPNLRTVAYSEIEAFACELLLARMEGGQLDAAPIWPNLKTFPWEEFRDRVDILSGGYPCQPFSAAGKRLGTEDPRHLWPFIADGIRILRPKLCFFENVEGHISLGLREVIAELGSLGYEVSWGIFSAAEVGAPHQRKRVFILAHRNGERGQLPHWGRLAAEQVSVGNGAAWGDVWPSRPGQPQFGWEPPRVVANGKESGWPSGRVAGDLGGTAPEEGCRGNQPASPATDCGGTGAEKAMGNSNGLHRSASTEGRQHDAEAGRAGEAMGNAESGKDNGRESRDLGIETSSRRSSDDAANAASEGLGNTKMFNGAGQAGGQRETQTGRTGSTQYERQIESTLGRDADGAAGRLGYAELQVSCDNRTDELRLLGNGVVPATAELAFRTLFAELTQPEMAE